MKTLAIVILLLLGVRVCDWFLGVDLPLPACATDKPVNLSGVILESKLHAGPPERLTMVIRAEQVSDCDVLLGRTLRLSWYRPQAELLPDQRLQAEVRLKRTWGSLNAGGFNYRLWLLSHHVSATGYLVGAPRLLESKSHARPPAHKVRELSSGELIAALALGQTGGVTRAEWALFRTTGTIHLMVVSGLHVGILASLSALILNLLLTPFASWFDVLARRYIIVCGVSLLVLMYAVIAGLAPPVVRAAVMFCVIAAGFLTLRRPDPLQTLAVVGVGSALWMPEQILQQGFWLSYAAVAALLFTFASRLRRGSWLASLIVCQLVLFAALTPVIGYVVGAAPLLSPLANLLVVPLVTLVTIPAAMISVVLSWIDAQSLARLSAAVVGISMQMTKIILQQFPPLDVGYLGKSQLLCLSALFGLLFVPLSRKIQLLALALWPLVLMSQPTRLSPGEFIVRVLDVGQGAAAIVDTRNYRLLVDAGPRFGDTLDSGRDVVLPVLRSTGLNQLHTAVITHFDDDHAGGLQSLRERFPSMGLKSPEENCPHNVSWQWDGVRFTTLRVAGATSSNAGSCTLLIDNAKRTVYFSGDIDRATELALLRYLPRGLDLLIAPHHGSRSSSHPAFVARLAPAWTIFTAGRDNRYRHPHADVVERYTKVQSFTAKTWQTGQLTYYSEGNAIYRQRTQLGRVHLPFVRELHQSP